MTKALESINLKGGENDGDEEVFNLILVDIKETYEMDDIRCVKKNMYDPNLKYIAISYRWGEWQEQLIKTPDYTAHITSFNTVDLKDLCYFITKDPDLKEILYLWVDTISIDQHNHLKKKETILKMNQIYKRASYILAVPDLHWHYLKKNTSNHAIMDFIHEHRVEIHNSIYHSITYSNNNSDTDDINNSITNSTQHFNSDHCDSVIQQLMNMSIVKENDELRKKNEELNTEIDKLKKEIEELRIEKKLKQENELKEAYRFLAYLIEDWSNRAWVISEYQIAKDKYNQHGTPLKYIFLSLLKDGETTWEHKPFFSYSFDSQHNSNDSNTNNDSVFYYKDVDNGSNFISFLKSKFIQRPYINLIIGSNASRNEDRFHAIFSSWKKYNHVIKNQNTISDWNIIDMTSVRLKLYETIYDGDDLWDKARLLYLCTNTAYNSILPSFATTHEQYFIITEIDGTDYNYENTIDYLSKNNTDTSKKYDRNEWESTFKQNLIDIQFNKQHCSLSIKVDKYFVFPEIPSYEELLSYSLKIDNSLKLIYIPFFTYVIPETNDKFNVGLDSIPYLSGTLLIGNMDINRWILYQINKCEKFGNPKLSSTDGYIFNIY